MTTKSVNPPAKAVGARTGAFDSGCHRSERAQDEFDQKGRKLEMRNNYLVPAILAVGVLLITYVPWLTLGLLGLLGRG